MTEHAIVVCTNENHDTRYLSYLLASMQLGRLSGQSAQPGPVFWHQSRIK